MDGLRFRDKEVASQEVWLCDCVIEIWLLGESIRRKIGFHFRSVFDKVIALWKQQMEGLGLECRVKLEHLLTYSAKTFDCIG